MNPKTLIFGKLEPTNIVHKKVFQFLHLERISTPVHVSKLEHQHFLFFLKYISNSPASRILFFQVKNIPHCLIYCAKFSKYAKFYCTCRSSFYFLVKPTFYSWTGL